LNRGISLNWEKSRALLVLGVCECCLNPQNCVEKARELLMESVRCDQKNYDALTFLVTLAGGKKEILQDMIDSLEKTGHDNAAFFLRHELGDAFPLYQSIGAQLRMDLEKIVDSCRTRSVKMIFVNYPDEENPVLREVAAEKSISFVDMFEAFNRLWDSGEKRWDYFLPDLHCTEQGNRKIAEVLKPAVLEALAK
jgi:hypothetical protein